MFLNKHSESRGICLTLFTALILVFAPFEAASGGLMSFATKILRHADDFASVGKAGKKAGAVLRATEKADLLKRLPELKKAGQLSDDLLLGAKKTLDFAAKGPAQKRLVDALENPAPLMKMVEKNPESWKVIDGIAGTLSTTKLDMAALAKTGAIPAEVVQKMPTVLKSYESTAEAAMALSRKGGPKAMEIAKKLGDIIKNNPKTTVAVGVLAWFTLDPDGAEAAVEKVLKGPTQVVTGVATNVTKDIVTNTVEGAGEIVTESVKSLDSSLGKVVATAKESPLAISFILLLVVILVPPVRRRVLPLIAVPFNMVAAKIQNAAPSTQRQNPQNRNTVTPSSTVTNFKASLRRGLKCKTRK